MEKCKSCGVLFDRNTVSEAFDEKYGLGIYDYCYSVDDFCFECAEEILEQNEDDPNEPPDGCRECGGPWPNCTTSCPLYDD